MAIYTSLASALLSLQKKEPHLKLTQISCSIQTSTYRLANQHPNPTNMVPSQFLSLSLACLALTDIAASTAPKIAWSPCSADEFNTTLELQCGNLTVSLD